MPNPVFRPILRRVTSPRHLPMGLGSLLSCRIPEGFYGRPSPLSNDSTWEPFRPLKVSPGSQIVGRGFQPARNDIIMRIFDPAFVAGATLALAATGVAGADRLTTTGNVNLRAGAGVNHARITTLPVGTAVLLDHCRQGWCLVESLGLSGWVSARFLSGADVVERYYPPVVQTPPVAKLEPVVPRNYHDLGLSHHHRPTRNFHEDRR
jgi:uncharacterized protein YraI